MPDSYVEYTATSGQTDFNFSFPYLEANDVKVMIDGAVTDAFSLLDADTVRLNTGATLGATVRVFRDTDLTELRVTFTDSSTLTADNLNNAFRQFLYVAQEAKDTNDELSASIPSYTP